MDHVNDLPDMHGVEPSVHDLRPGTSPTDVVTFDDLRELRLTSLEDVVALLRKYVELKVPKDPGDVFLEQLTQRRDAWFVEVGDIGLVYLTNIVPGASGMFNVLFWDQRLSRERIPLVQRVLQAAFNLFALQRVSAFAVASAESKPFEKFLTRIGFQAEGLVRKSRFVDGEFVDVALYGLIQEDTQSWQLTTSSAR